MKFSKKTDDDFNHIKRVFGDDLRKLQSVQKKDHDALHKLNNWVDEYKKNSTASVSKSESPIEEQKSSTETKKSGE